MNTPTHGDGFEFECFINHLEMAIIIPRSDPTTSVEPLCLQDAKLLLENDYLPFEAGGAFTAHNTDQYKL